MPSSRNGNASMKMPRKMVVKVCNLSGTDTGVVKAASMDDWLRATVQASTNASTTSITVPTINGMRRRRARFPPPAWAISATGYCVDIALIITPAVLRSSDVA